MQPQQQQGESTLSITTAPEAISDGVDLATSDPRQALVPFYILPESLSWSPDSSWLAYTTSDGRAWLQAADGDQPIEITGVQAAPPARLIPAWSSGGDQLIVYGICGFDYPLWTAMWLVAINTGGIKEIRPLIDPSRASSPVYQNEGVVYSASWSSDSRKIAYTFMGEAWVYDAEEDSHSQVTRITLDPIIRDVAIESFNGVKEVSWSPDSKWLALGLSCNCQNPYSGVAALEISTGNVKLLADGAGNVGWSPDGQWVTIKNVSGDWGPEYTYDFYGADPATGDLINLTSSNPDFDPLLDGYDHFRPGTYQVAELHWGPDGIYLYTIRAYMLGDQGVQDKPAIGFVVREDPVTPP